MDGDVGGSKCCCTPVEDPVQAFKRPLSIGSQAKQGYLGSKPLLGPFWGWEGQPLVLSSRKAYSGVWIGLGPCSHDLS